MQRFLSQSFCIPEPTLTEMNCDDQSGRVFIITGGYAGVGFELSKMLYSRNATIYIAGRSPSKAETAIAAIDADSPDSKGRLEFMNVDFADRKTIKPAVEDFLTKETKLHVLVNNAGVMFPPKGSTDSHGNDLQIGTNCIGPYLLFKLLRPILARTAATSPAGSVRVTWAGSLGIDTFSPSGGMALDPDGKPLRKGVQADYGQSKVANLFFAKEFAKTTPETGIIHACFNPGNLQTELQRHGGFITNKFGGLILHPAKYGGYTELYAALSPDITLKDSGAYIHPWGRYGGWRKDINPSMKSVEEGGTGVAVKFVEWCEKTTAPFA